MSYINQASRVVVLGNGAQTVFNYAFWIPSKSVANLWLRAVDGTETLVSPASWTLNNANNRAGGTFAYPTPSGTPLQTGEALILERQVPATQPTTLGNQSAYYPQTVEDMVNWVVLCLQQTVTEIGDALTFPLGDPGGVDHEMPGFAERQNRVMGWDANGEVVALDLAVDISAVAAIAAQIVIVAGIASEVVAVADIDAEVVTVAGIASAVVAVALNAANVTAVGTNIANVNAVAANAANINAVAANAVDIDTVAASIASINTAAANIAAINTVSTNMASVIIAAANVADIENFADVYLGAHTTDPTTRTDGSPLQPGDMYFNTVSTPGFRGYTGSVWIASIVAVSAYMAGVLLSVNANDAQINLGGGAAGRAVFSSSSQANARTALGVGATGDSLFTAATAAAARTTLGSTSVGDALFIAASAAAARTTLGATTVGANVFTAADAAAARAAISAPAIPTASAGVGNFIAIQTATGSAAVLPAGGSWGYSIICINTGTGVWIGGGFAGGTGAGGTSIGGATPSGSWMGFAWRYI